MKNRFLLFKAPFEVAVEEEEINFNLADDEVLLRTEKSGISAGTERLLFRGEFPRHLTVDANIKGLNQTFQYPLKYGYAAVGHVVETGSRATHWLHQRAFVFAPHQEWIVAKKEQLIAIPDSLSSSRATLLAHMETAISLVTDGAPVIAERIAIVGMGLVGLMTLHLLKGFPAADLVAVDTDPRRRALAQQWGAHTANSSLFSKDTSESKAREHFDLIFELSGKPETLNDCIDAAAFAGRIVVGSFYGGKSAAINLGGAFHRERLQVISSQVSRISGTTAGRITKEQRLAYAARQLHQVPFEDLRTMVVPMEEAPRIYSSLCEHPRTNLHWVIDYAA